MARQIMTALTAAALMAGATAASAQSLGSFSWQLQPYCNVVTVAVTQNGSTYTLDGYDDQCGASQRASVVGMAFSNPNGSIGLGFTTVSTPGGTPMHVDATVSLATVSGTWKDSGGNSGTFAFTAGAGTGGSPRPVPAGGLPPGSITATQLAPGAITAAQIAPGSLTAAVFAPGAVQSRIAGVCQYGQAMRGINPDGTVACTNVSQTLGSSLEESGRYGRAIGSDGYPIFAYQNDSAGTLWVTHCGDPACRAGNVTTENVAPGGEDASITVGANGLPLISHHDGVELRVTRCGNLRCSAGNATVTVDQGPGQRGRYSSIAIGTDGNPVIAYQVQNASTVLRVTHCGNPTCTAGNVANTVADAPQSGTYAWLAIGSDGLPIMSHHDGNDLRVTQCVDIVCSSGQTAVFADSVTETDGHTSIAVGRDGLPVISYWDSNGDDLWVTHCGTRRCLSGNASQAIDAGAREVGRYSSIAIGSDGLPLIVYYDETTEAIRTAHCDTAACATVTLGLLTPVGRG